MLQIMKSMSHFGFGAFSIQTKLQPSIGLGIFLPLIFIFAKIEINNFILAVIIFPSKSSAGDQPSDITVSLRHCLT